MVSGLINPAFNATGNQKANAYKSFLKKERLKTTKIYIKLRRRLEKVN